MEEKAKVQNLSNTQTQIITPETTNTTKKNWINAYQKQLLRSRDYYENNKD